MRTGRNEKEKKKRDQPGQGDSGQEGHGKGAKKHLHDQNLTNTLSESHFAGCRDFDYKQLAH